jgi:hypothetical protein
LRNTTGLSFSKICAPLLVGLLIGPLLWLSAAGKVSRTIVRIAVYT